ncbi:zinc-dependent metalloprotease [Butyricimonas paravirosa]|uniref:zinc-dependent metalloprotease n=1 Tax=Butyricimonas paravirosa TaxID=1472417 RepID=UPI0022E0E802|nr:zinc-dependent metalloprotease [Butyricimonas paravirosa]
MRNILYICFLSFFLFGWGVQGQAKKKNKEKKETLTAYQKLFKGKQVKTAHGLMTVHKIGDKVLVEFPIKLLGKDMMLTSSIENISDNGEGVVGQFAGYGLPFCFTRLDSTLQARIFLIDKPLNNSLETNWNEAIERSNAGGVYGTFKIKAYTPDSTAVVVDMTPLFMEYSPYTTPFTAIGGNSFFGLISREHEYKKECSMLKDVDAFDNNIMVTCELGFVENQYLFGAFKVIPGDVKVSVTTNKMLMLLPEEPMRPRLADPRLGVSFMEVSQVENDRKGLKSTFYTKRWRVEPVDEAAHRRGEVVEVKKPIVFYMDTLMPKEWQPYIKEGIEAWNEAFEKIGFKDVVRVMDFPKDDPDFNANNIKYSTIRYAPLWLDMQNSMHVDPRTGEILNASLYIYDGLVSGLKTNRMLTTMATDPSVRTTRFSEEMIGELIRVEIMREAGINLGLVYNAGASAVYPVDSLRSPSFTREHGLSPSVMDYVPCNYIAQPGDVEKGVRMVPGGLGEYDYYVIRWLYEPIPTVTTLKDEFATLDRWIREGRTNPKYRFGKVPYYYYDPRCFTGDLGDDHLKALEYAVNNLKITVRNFYDWYAEGDEDLSLRSQLYNLLRGQLQKRINDVSVNLGGFYQMEAFSTEKEPSYVVVTGTIQKAAVKCMIDMAKDLAWLENKAVEKKLEIRNSNVDQIRSFILGTLTFRLKYVALGAEKGGDYSLAEYIEDIYRNVWDGTLKNRPLEKYEMDLQKEFLGSVVASSTIATTAGNFTPRRGITMVGHEGAISPKTIDRKQLDLIREQLAVLPEKGMNPEERNGFYPTMRVVMPGDYIPVNYYFDMLFKIQDLLKGAVTKSSGETKLHYEYLLYKINKMLANK